MKQFLQLTFIDNQGIIPVGYVNINNIVSFQSCTLSSGEPGTLINKGGEHIKVKESPEEIIGLIENLA